MEVCTCLSILLGLPDYKLLILNVSGCQRRRHRILLDALLVDLRLVLAILVYFDLLRFHIAQVLSTLGN